MVRSFARPRDRWTVDRVNADMTVSRLTIPQAVGPSRQKQAKLRRWIARHPRRAIWLAARRQGEEMYEALKPLFKEPLEDDRMGMDVFGKAPKDKSGEYFRASVWSWRPLCSLMEQAGFAVPVEWTLNDGAGLDNQAECDYLANLIEADLAQNPGGFSIPAPRGLKVNDAGQLSQAGTRSPYEVSEEHVREWVTFLRSCGGFKIC